MGAGQAGLALSHELRARGVGPFIGVHFFRKRKSSLLVGVGEDAAIDADRMARGG